MHFHVPPPGDCQKGLVLGDYPKILLQEVKPANHRSFALMRQTFRKTIPTKIQEIHSSLNSYSGVFNTCSRLCAKSSISSFESLSKSQGRSRRLLSRAHNTRNRPISNASSGSCVSCKPLTNKVQSAFRAARHLPK